MPVNANRAANFNLGVNLGWLQQGSAFGGRQISEMTADLERVRATAAKAGYKGYEALVNNARGQLTSSQHANSALDEISTLITLFQSQAEGTGAAALNLGIVLGWLQQGSKANNRLVAMATADLESARTHAENAGYHSYEGYINNASTKLSFGQPVSSILGEITALTGLFQGQG
ncbi:MAG TPA: hypothetical protein VGG03_27850 [Thermoanaerobaculia bacterium]|jgi:hypothetical protein